MSTVGRIKRVDTALLTGLSTRAVESPRRRANHNLHPTLDDPVQRLFNALAPGTYVRPHRHLGEGRARWELFVVLAGRVAVLTFDDGGTVVERAELDANGELRAIEIPVGVWHGLAVLAPGSVVFEVKAGPYAPLGEADFADWAPVESDDAAAFVAFCETALPGACFGGRLINSGRL